MKLSIIIPIYNSEKYLSKCLESIINQDSKSESYEIILVNDGSTDNSLSICNQYASFHSNIKIKTIDNSGPATAKNIGLEVATGNYVSFIDSDDEVMPDMFIEMLENAYKHDSDIVCCSYIQIDEQGNKSHEECSNKEYILNKSEAMKHLLDKDMIYSQCWTKIYKRKMLTENNLSFIDGFKTEEDFIFNLYTFLNSNIITIIDKPLYIYRHHNSSLSRKYYLNHVQQFMKNMSFRLKITAKEINNMFPELNDICTIHCLLYYNILLGRIVMFPYIDIKKYFNEADIYMKKNASLLFKNHSKVGISLYGALVIVLFPQKLYYLYRRRKINF